MSAIQTYFIYFSSVEWDMAWDAAAKGGGKGYVGVYGIFNAKISVQPNNQMEFLVNLMNFYFVSWIVYKNNPT